jgi:hypothetical protein
LTPTREASRQERKLANQALNKIVGACRHLRHAVGRSRAKDRPFAMIDLYGTPYTEKLHVVERYRLLDYEDAKEGLERDAKENQQPPVGIDRSYRGKHLQIHFTVEDEGVFTTPWSATITYGRGSTEWPETVCAENTQEYYNHKESDVPRADKPDF